MNFFSSFDGLIWLLVALIILTFLQGALHREIQSVFLLLTRNSGLTQVIFGIIFFPGVFLHEMSHFFAAKLMGIQTGRFSLIPSAQPNGMLRLGYVETASGGFMRDALIGIAPLLTGSLFVAFAGIYGLHLLPLWDFFKQAEWKQFWTVLMAVPRSNDFWLWLYLIFTISSTMMPSASDRHAWLPLGLLAGAMVGVAILTGAGPWMLANLAPEFNSFLRSSALIFVLSGVLHLLLVAPFLMLHLLLSRLTGLKVK